jgi:DHA1 family multidrug resistance protein-like MFS transporter
MNLNWRWSFILLAIIAGVVFCILFFLLPETMHSTILLRRAQRLRKLTGNPLLRAPCELGEESNLTVLNVLKENLVHAAQISVEPAMLVISTYLGLVYGVLYTVGPLSSALAPSSLIFPFLSLLPD